MAGDEMTTAVVLGSGLGPAAKWLREEQSAYEVPTANGVPGHALTVSKLDSGVILFSGRRHLYEGCGMERAVAHIKKAYNLGCDTLILTNMVGAVGLFPAGKPVLISDHINLTGQNPLVGPQFIDLADAYSPRLRAIAKEVDPSLREAVYAQLLGPTYETPAEVRWLRSLGVGLVGMSVAIETIQARALGMEVLALSIPADSPGDEPITHEGVLNVAAEAADEVGELIAGVIHHLA